jgi:hypothetical protein
MKLQKLFSILILLTFCQSFAQQGNGEKRKKIKALKIAFITTELDLTPDEATKFWPIFNAFDDKQVEIRSQKTKQFLDKSEDEELEKMSDKEALQLLIQIENSEDDLYQNRKKFMLNLRGVISPIKILKLKKAEDNFSRKLLKQYQKQ